LSFRFSSLFLRSDPALNADDDCNKETTNGTMRESVASTRFNARNGERKEDVR